MPVLSSTPPDVTALGAELCVAPVVFISFMVVTMTRVVRDGLDLPRRPFMSIVLNLVGILAGVSLILRRGGGMYLVALEFLATIVWVMWGAWGPLLAIGVEDRPVGGE